VQCRRKTGFALPISGASGVIDARIFVRTPVAMVRDAAWFQRFLAGNSRS
jgi:hypothetical protein